MDRTGDAVANRALLDDESDDLDSYVARRARADPRFPQLVEEAVGERRARRSVDGAWRNLRQFAARLARDVAGRIRR